MLIRPSRHDVFSRSTSALVLLADFACSFGSRSARLDALVNAACAKAVRLYGLWNNSAASGAHKSLVESSVCNVCSKGELTRFGPKPKIEAQNSGYP